MDARRHRPTGTIQNAMVFSTADELEEVNYENMAKGNVDKPALTSGKKHLNHLLIITVSWGILLLVMVPRIYFTSVLSEKNSQLMTENRRLSLKIQELQDNNTLQSQNRNLTIIIRNMTQASALFEREKEQLKSKNQELQEKIEKLGVVNVSMTQSIIDAYCPKPTRGERKCHVCPLGWGQNQFSCYVANHVKPEDRRSWEDAEKDCRAKGPHLAVIDNDSEKNFILEWIWGPIPYWIGLKVVDGEWKWLNGASQSQTSWIGSPQNGHCATSFNEGISRAVACTLKHRWICEKKALTL